MPAQPPNLRMPSMHSMLARQLRRSLKAESQAEADNLLNRLFELAESGTLESEQAQALSGLRTLLGSVDESYRQFDRAQELRLRSLTVSSAELLEANQRLRAEAERQQSLITTMRAIANRLLAAAGRDAIPEDEVSAQRVAQLMEQLIDEGEAAQRRLSESSARYLGLTSLSSDWYWEQDEQQRFTLMSQGITAVTGRPPEAFIGLTGAEAFGVDAAQSDASGQHRLLALMQSQQPLRDFELHYKTSGNVPVWMSLSAEPQRDGEGKFTGYRGVARNITAQKQAEQRLQEALDLTETLLDATPAPTSIKDAELRFVRVNTAFERMFGDTRERWLGRTAREIRGDAAALAEATEHDLLANPRVIQYEQTRTVSGGRQVHYFVTKAPMVVVGSRRVTHLISTYMDITEIKRVQGEMTRQLALTDALIETMPMPVSIKDREHRFVRVNAAYEREFELVREIVLGQTVVEALNDASAGGREVELEMLRNPGVRSYARERVGRDGRERCFSITKSTIQNDAGEVTGFITLHADITGIKQVGSRLDEQLALTTTLLDASPTPTVVKDRNLILTRCNSAYEKLFNVRREDILHQPMSGHRTQFSDAVLAVERQLLVNPGTHRVERALRVPGRDDVHCVIEKSTYFNTAGEVEGVITSFTDITELKRTEENLREAKLLAEQALRVRSQFLANMSHEIRTPMNGVLGMAEVLSGTVLSAEQREYLDTIRTSGESLLKIVGDILDFSKIEAGKVDIEQVAFDPRSRVESLVQLFSASAREKNLQVSGVYSEDLPPEVMGDPVRISQVLSNLLGNAIKFTQAGSITLHAGIHAQAGQDVMLRFDVRDSGIGISKDAIERIFDPFSQEDTSITRRFGGTGLGLTISRQLVGLMGGELSVVSTQGEGSCFSFTVRVQKDVKAPPVEPVEPVEPAAAAAAPQMTGPRGAAPLNILLVEDNTINQIVAAAMLKKLNCDITVVNDGQEAVAAIQARRFDVILMDCHMPNMDGFAATAAVRTWEQQGHARHIIIAQTANAMEGDRESCLAAGMDDYIAKPLTTAVLAQMLARWTAHGTANA